MPFKERCLKQENPTKNQELVQSNIKLSTKIRRLEQEKSQMLNQLLLQEELLTNYVAKGGDIPLHKIKAFAL